MKFSYDKKEDILAIWFSQGKYAKSEEVSEGVILDRDKQGRIIGIEILDASEQTPTPFRSAIERHILPIEYATQLVWGASRCITANLTMATASEKPHHMVGFLVFGYRWY